MKTKIIFKELFYILTFALLVFSCLEFIFPGMVLSYLNINIILLVWLFDAIILLVIKYLPLKSVGK